MKIYTKTGDRGETSLYTGQRIRKDDAFLHALGTVDECNSALGMALSQLPPLDELLPYREQLERIQHALFDLGAHIATPLGTASEKKKSRTHFGKEGSSLLERWIDEITEKLPPLKTFILPGGHPAAAALHLARSICRRAERHAVPLSAHTAISSDALVYLNRLSDYLFTLSRLINQMTKSPETPWNPHLGPEMDTAEGRPLK